MIDRNFRIASGFESLKNASGWITPIVMDSLDPLGAAPNVADSPDDSGSWPATPNRRRNSVSSASVSICASSDSMILSAIEKMPHDEYHTCASLRGSESQLPPSQGPAPGDLRRLWGFQLAPS